MEKKSGKGSFYSRIAVFGCVLLLIAGVFTLKQMRPGAVFSTPAVGNIPALQVVEPFDLEELRSSGLPVLVSYGADSCAACKEMKPILEELHGELAGKAILLFVDVFKYRSLAEGVPLRVIPTQIFFDAEGSPFKPDDSLGVPFLLYTSKEEDVHLFTVHEGGLRKEELLTILQAMGI